jgi:hypothetical protein
MIRVERPTHTPASLEAGLRAAAEAHDIDVMRRWLYAAVVENRAGRLGVSDLTKLRRIASEAMRNAWGQRLH